MLWDLEQIATLSTPRGSDPRTVLRSLSICLALLPLAPRGLLADEAFRVDAAFPGGNIVVTRLAGDKALVAPDLRDTQAGEWWFYWNLRVRGPADKRLTITFTDKNPIGVRGPAVSTDAGATWRWLGAAAVKTARVDGRQAWSFEARIPAGQSEVRYAFCPPYTDSHLQAWLADHAQQPALRVEELCRSRKGRPVERLHAGCLDRTQSRGLVLLTSRHHACEALATYALEGCLSAVLADDELGRLWRAQWEVVAVPFMDRDGVTDGDQGKNRAPHDHNRDYNAQPLYPEVAAMQRWGQAQRDRVVAVIDLHCPHIRGEWNDRAYFVGPPDDGFWQKECRFAAVLAETRQGPIRFRAQDCLAFNTAWNTNANTRQGKSFGNWSREVFPDARLIASLELAYADALGDEVNADSARAFGRDLARALAKFLEK